MVEAASSLAVDSFLLCEDIRAEMLGQYSLVGVLSDVLAVPMLPVTFPKLGVLVRLSGIGPGKYPYCLTITDQTQACEVACAKGKYEQGPTSESMLSTFIIRFGAVQVRSWGLFTLAFEIGEAEAFRRSLRLRPPSWDMIYVRCSHCQSLVPSGIGAAPGATIRMSRNQVQCSQCHGMTELDDRTAVRLTPPSYTLGPATAGD